MSFKTLFLFLMFTSFVNAQEVKESTFKKEKLKLDNSIILDDKLKETSGLIHWNDKLWTHNDDTDTNLYALNTVNGSVEEVYSLSGATNKDWEEIAQDENYLYIGDFGNNASGNRKDLNILRVEKESLLLHKPVIDYIKFGYKNQNGFKLENPNQTNFDCEAFVVAQDSIFLFAKEWKTKKTTFYKIPKTPENYIAEQKAIFNTKDLVTGACLFENTLALCGYTKKGKPFVDLFYDFKNNDFFSGKHLKIKLKPRFRQIEAITTQDGLKYYVTNESLRFPLVNVPQQLNVLDLSEFVNKLK